MTKNYSQDKKIKSTIREIAEILLRTYETMFPGKREKIGKEIE